MFRSDPGKFKKLKHECHDFFKQCDEFLILVTSLEVMVINIEAVDLPQIIDQVCNWQVQLVMHDQIVGNVFCMITILFFSIPHCFSISNYYSFHLFLSWFLRTQQPVLLTDYQRNMLHILM